MDKWHWIEETFDGLIKEKDFLCVMGSKVEAVQKLRPITKADILIDDFNPNLEAWQKAGGSVIKYVNGINSMRNDMPCISANDPFANATVIDELIASLKKQ